VRPYVKTTNKSGYICGGSWARDSSLTGDVLSEEPQLHLQAIYLGRRTQPNVHSMAILRQVRGTADGAAQWDSAHPGDHRCPIAKSQSGPSWGNPAVQPELGPVALRDVVPQQAHTFRPGDDSIFVGASQRITPCDPQHAVQKRCAGLWGEAGIL
jgi:hypothetical protein